MLRRVTFCSFKPNPIYLHASITIISIFILYFLLSQYNSCQINNYTDCRRYLTYRAENDEAQQQPDGNVKGKSHSLQSSYLETHDGVGNSENKINDETISDEKSKAAVERDNYLKSMDEQIESFMKRHPESESYYNTNITMLPEQTKGVIILTNQRSGSTFLGELFNQHPEAFYSFEPLNLYGYDCQRHLQAKVDIMQGILKCDFPNVKAMFKKFKPDIIRTGNSQFCFLNNFCHRRPQVLKEKMFCPFTIGEYCGPLHLPRAMNLCRSKQVSVIKVIRICDIEDLRPIVEDPTTDIKILHLVRDPRGMINSRIKAEGPVYSTIEEDAKVTCRWLFSNGVRGLTNISEHKWLEGKYMSIRYEDVATQPEAMTEKIYNFVGLYFYPHLKELVYEKTHANIAVNEDLFGTTRNASATVQAWRKSIGLKQVLSVQKLCNEAMTLFGYEKVFNARQLRDTEFQVIRPI